MARRSMRARLIGAAVLVAIVVLGAGAGVTRAAVSARADNQALAYAQTRLAVIATVYVQSHGDTKAVVDAVGGDTVWALDSGSGTVVARGLWERYLAAGQ